MNNFHTTKVYTTTTEVYTPSSVKQDANYLMTIIIIIVIVVVVAIFVIVTVIYFGNIFV